MAAAVSRRPERAQCVGRHTRALGFDGEVDEAPRGIVFRGFALQDHDVDNLPETGQVRRVA